MTEHGHLDPPALPTRVPVRQRNTVQQENQQITLLENNTILFISKRVEIVTYMEKKLTVQLQTETVTRDSLC